MYLAQDEVWELLSLSMDKRSLTARLSQKVTSRWSCCGSCPLFAAFSSHLHRCSVLARPGVAEVLAIWQPLGRLSSSSLL